MAATCPTGYGMTGMDSSAGLVVVTVATDKAVTEFGWEAKISSASCTTWLKLALMNSQWAIPATTFPGSWHFHKAAIMPGQQSHDIWCLHMS